MYVIILHFDIQNLQRTKCFQQYKIIHSSVVLSPPAPEHQYEPPSSHQQPEYQEQENSYTPQGIDQYQAEYQAQEYQQPEYVAAAVAQPFENASQVSSDEIVSED